MLHEEEWHAIKNPDVLMIPIGGKTVHNTMDEKEALRAVKIMNPKFVIPCHCNCPAFFTKNYNPADDEYIRHGIERTGARCVILLSGDSVYIGDGRRPG